MRLSQLPHWSRSGSVPLPGLNPWVSGALQATSFLQEAPEDHIHCNYNTQQPRGHLYSLRAKGQGLKPPLGSICPYTCFKRPHRYFYCFHLKLTEMLWICFHCLHFNWAMYWDRHYLHTYRWLQNFIFSLTLFLSGWCWIKSLSWRYEAEIYLEKNIRYIIL